MLEVHVRTCIMISVVMVDCYTQEFFENPAFRADGLKIYPTLVIRGTGKTHTHTHIHTHTHTHTHTHVIYSHVRVYNIVY